MRIFLDAYFDNNFGDDLFVDTLLGRYPDAMFYAFWKNTPASVLNRAAQFENLVIIPSGCVMQGGWPFDAYVMIGGDVLPDGVDYSERIAWMKHVKKCGGFVAMLGFSLYKEYGEKTIGDLKTMAELADTIVIRDQYSAERFRALVPEADVIASTDMVFARGLIKKGAVNDEIISIGEVDADDRSGLSGEPADTTEKDNILGIIPRRKLYSTDEEHLAYCRTQAAIADAYLQKYPKAKVRFLAFSTGEYDDRVTSKDIVAQMQCAGVETKTEIIGYEGMIENFLEAIRSCRALLPTRFHGMVLALIYRVPFVPVPYEVKLTQLLDELEYTGIRVPYGEEVASEQVEEVVNSLEQLSVSEELLGAYEKKSALFFDDLDKWSEEYTTKPKPDLGEFTVAACAVGSTCKDLHAENEMLKKQVDELNKWIASLQEQRDGFEQQNQELGRLSQEQQKTIQELSETIQEQGKQAKQQADFAQQQVEIAQQQAEIAQQRASQILLLESDKNMLTQQIDELMKWIESLKKERATFERQNMELESIRQWQWDQLMRVPLMSRKIETEYNNFLQSLREKLDKQSGL